MQLWMRDKNIHFQNIKSHDIYIVVKEFIDHTSYCGQKMANTTSFWS